MGLQKELIGSALIGSTLLLSGCSEAPPPIPNPLREAFSQTVAKSAEFMLEHEQRIDYSVIVNSEPDTRIMFFGPNDGLGNKDEVNEVVSSFKQLGTLGFTHFVTRIVSADLQDDLNVYLDTGEKKEELIKNLSENGGLSMQASQMHLNMLKEASKAGFQVLGIAMPDDHFDKGKAESVKAVLSTPGNKLLIYGGGPGRIMDEFNWFTQGTPTEIPDIEVMINGADNLMSVYFYGCQLVPGIDSEVNLVEESARKADLGNARFMVPAYISPQDNMYDSYGWIDWQLHIPTKR